MNLSTDNEAYSTGSSIYAGTKGRLHPSGKYIYGADNGLSPSDIENMTFKMELQPCFMTLLTTVIIQ